MRKKVVRFCKHEWFKTRVWTIDGVEDQYRCIHCGKLRVVDRTHDPTVLHGA